MPLFKKKPEEFSEIGEPQKSSVMENIRDGLKWFGIGVPKRAAKEGESAGMVWGDRAPEEII